MKKELLIALVLAVIMVLGGQALAYEKLNDRNKGLMPVSMGNGLGQVSINTDSLRQEGQEEVSSGVQDLLDIALNPSLPPEARNWAIGQLGIKLDEAVPGSADSEAIVNTLIFLSDDPVVGAAAVSALAPIGEEVIAEMSAPENINVMHQGDGIRDEIYEGMINIIGPAEETQVNPPATFTEPEIK